MVVLSVLSVLALPVIQTGLNAYAVQKDLREASSQGRLALERMARDIASLPSDKAILLASSSALHFTDNTNTAVGYEQVGTRLERNHLTLADGVQSLDFFYADNAGEATNILENIRYVRIRLIMIENNLDFTVERVVMLRNQGS
jgi:type II secretory pathway pseudopilin PulG